ncbi:hypothetical protein VTL71DRAFT_6815 [Oculimacula yallundae]|uniref:Uncharacterized protein n=1 Tax=Oculimacula yallundae TaxID=86028 RepID=A0ABR4BY00_9HELO
MAAVTPNSTKEDTKTLAREVRILDLKALVKEEEEC